jgi:ATP-dependent DNA helicase RecQ
MVRVGERGTVIGENKPEEPRNRGTGSFPSTSATILLMQEVTDRAADPVLEAISRHWGFSELRPLQRQAIDAVLGRRDSLLVVPTGGGKSLCYQAPAVVGSGLTVVVSPLISLMKDQVDSLIECGVSAAQLNSSQSPLEQRALERDLLDGHIKLLFVSPERLAMPTFRETLRRAGVTTFAIDEAHCISHWGHDFRPEYRQLRELRTLYPDASIHAYTATATERVRRDIVEQLGLRNPEVLIGDIDRPNLTYRILPRRDELQQIEEILARHKGEAGIIYCIRRKDVDAIAPELARRGHRAVGYHAGMTQDQRREGQDAFAAESVDLVVATVAFGMGIDRSNVRFVIHTGSPKSIEHFQQETGRAGRDGLEAECVLLYSGSDAALWKSILEKSSEIDAPQDHLATAFRQIELMDRFCAASLCRHRALVEHFGGVYPRENCGACDVCLGDLQEVPDAATIAQKILSCVARVRQSFGAGHVISILRGEKLQKVIDRNHDQLSTFGLLREHDKKELRDWISQLVSQQILRQEGDTYPILRLTEAAWKVMKGELPVRLVSPPAAETVKRSSKAAEDWTGVDRGLFDELRAWRRERASERGVPPFVIFGDRTLRDLARVRPSSSGALRSITGIGEVKLRQFGDQVLSIVARYCHRKGVEMDRGSEAPRAYPQSRGAGRSAPKEAAIAAFGRGQTLEEVASMVSRSRATVTEYLCEFIASERPESVGTWVSDETYRAVAAAAEDLGFERLKPIRDRVGDAISYDEIRVVLAHLSTRA